MARAPTTHYARIRGAFVTGKISRSEFIGILKGRIKMDGKRLYYTTDDWWHRGKFIRYIGMPHA